MAPMPDLTPLTARIDRRELEEWKSAARRSGARWARIPIMPIIAMALLTLFFGAYVVALVIGIFRQPPDSGEVIGVILVGGVLSVVFGVVIGMLVQVAIRPWRRWLRLTRFAAANGLRYSPEEPAPLLPGAIFLTGQEREVTDHLRRDSGPRLDLGNYRARFGSGRGRHTRTWGYLAVQLDRMLPHMFLDARANNGILGNSNLPVAFRRDQVLSLEGDFDRHFTLYCPKEYERDALYVFTPDLMALLIDEAAPFDVEIADDWLFAYSRRALDLDDPHVVARLFRIVETVAAKARRQTRRYRDARSEVRGDVAPPARRLRRRVTTGTIVGVALIVGMWVFAIGLPLLATAGG